MCILINTFKARVFKKKHQDALLEYQDQIGKYSFKTEQHLINNICRTAPKEECQVSVGLDVPTI